MKEKEWSQKNFKPKDVYSWEPLWFPELLPKPGWPQPLHSIKCLKQFKKPTTTANIHTKQKVVLALCHQPKASSPHFLQVVVEVCAAELFSIRHFLFISSFEKEYIKLIAKLFYEAKVFYDVEGSFHSSTCSMLAMWLLAVSRQVLSSCFLVWG